MLSAAGVSRAARPPRSPRQEYQEFILQRIEEYKDTVPREDLLKIGDEAVRELETATAQQYLLTEVLVLEHVDRIIARRLKLPSYRRWLQTHRALRQAQRTPTHWGLAASHPVALHARRLEPGDLAVVIGAGALPHALLAAAFDAEVFLLDQDLGAVESADGRAVAEQLAARFQTLVIQFGSWFPDLHPSLAVIHAPALGAATPADRAALLADLKSRTLAGGVHIVLGAEGEPPDVLPLAADALQSDYRDWQIERGRRRKSGEGFVAIKPSRHSDTAANVSS